MMKNYVLIVLAVLCLSSCKTKSEDDGYRLDVTVKGLQNGKVYLLGENPFSKELFDSTKVENGKFFFEGKLKSPLAAMVVIKSEGEKENLRRMYTVILENKPMDLVVDANDQGMEIVSMKGSKLTDEMNAFKQSFKGYPRQMELLKEGMQAFNSKDNEKIASFKEEYGKLMEEYKNYLIEEIPANSKNFTLSYLVSKAIKYNPYIEQEKILKKFDPSMANSRYVKNLLERIERTSRVEIGQVAPDFALKDTIGTPVTLSSLRGKYVLVDFWASWCGPCCKELPEVVKLYNEYKDKGFEILGVSFDDKATRWKKAIKRFNMTWINVSDLKGWESEAGKLYNITGIPNNILLDAQGKIIAKNLHGEELKDKLKELIGSK